MGTTQATTTLELYDGTKVPCWELPPPDGVPEALGCNELFVFCHGLGEKASGYSDLLLKATASTAAKDKRAVPRTVIFDARGHGAAEGWQEGGPAQHHWRSLALDMMQVANAHGAAPGHGVIMGGCSMGAASALWSALLCPRSVRGLVLYMLPSVWELRAERRASLIQKATEMAASRPANADRSMGAARADLPSREDVGRLSVPTLLVSCRNDPVHPAASAEEVAALIGPSATLVLVDTFEELPDAFAKALPEWFATQCRPEVRTVALFDGTTVPCKELARPAAASPVSTSTPLLIFGHGMGGPNASQPKILREALESFAPKKPDFVPRAIYYDARGHGGSAGWHSGGPMQHHWRSLAVDMVQVAIAHGAMSCSKLILGGCSMGAASALWATLLSPRLVKGLVLYMTPTMWESRKSRRVTLEDKAEGMRQTDPANADRNLGAARADLPDAQEIERIDIPVLLVSCRNDPIHPPESAEDVAKLLGDRATLVVVDTKDELPAAFSAAFADWLDRFFS